ncbi:hypothetical protein EIB75_06180 [Epilithonimonas vandammei]|uniref:Cthe-2314-like HEPN domain-containing protein n=1 Tax=Epilithonimonas vandammei TaxID=2487072 RepID=A0A3G8ZE22_9FLAO|nr:hypothetical protein [Epilithonimonas vandammei]AZI54857.1 hypothetical protein EIB75_06180 [Epilithonimonas vandammei]
MVDYNIFPEEIKEKVLKQIGTSVKKFENLLENVYNQYQLYDKKIITLVKYENEIKKLLEFSTFLSISWLEISSDCNLYLKTKENYERALALKNLTIHLNEGYKKIYHFTESKRNKSLWIKNIMEICEDDKLQKFRIQTNELTEKLISYESQYQNDKFKDNRDIFVHYQGSPIEVYQALNNIDVSSLLKNATDYLRLTSDIINISTEITETISDNYSS